MQQSTSGSGQQIAIGALEESRLISVNEVYLSAAAKRNESKVFETVLVSPVVGAPITVSSVGKDLALAATNHAELVRLNSGWGSTKTLSVREALGARGMLQYGSIVTVGKNILVSLGFGSKISLLEVDPGHWTLIRSKTYEDRFGAFPQACATSDGVVGIVTSYSLDLVDVSTLERRKSVSLTDMPVGLACAGNTFWISAISKPQGHIVSSSGELVGEFHWAGKGSTRLVFNAVGQTVLGSDAAGGLVFSCRLDNHECRTSETVGSKPTDILALGSNLFVALEASQAIAVLDLGTLKLQGRTLFPGSPRTLTLVP